MVTARETPHRVPARIIEARISAPPFVCHEDASTILAEPVRLKPEGSFVQIDAWGSGLISGIERREGRSAFEERR